MLLLRRLLLTCTAAQVVNLFFLLAVVHTTRLVDN